MLNVHGMEMLRYLALCTGLLACGSSVVAPPAPTTEPPAPEPSASAQQDGPAEGKLSIVAEAQRRFTGVAVDGEGQIYVNFPRWSDDVPVSVARFDEAGQPQPFPDAAWNDWTKDADPARTWVCVQSVHVDAKGRLWVLDPGNPKFGGVVAGAPKLVLFELPSTKPARIVRFDGTVARKDSYLNDVRIDLAHDVAFLTDSGDGALIVVDLASGAARRVLDEHPSTQAEDIVLTIGGQPFNRKVHADGIAYDPEGDHIYYQALTGRTLYRISGEALRDAGRTEPQLAGAVQRVATSGASDGLLFYDGRVWLSSLEHDAIRTVRVGEEPETAVVDPRISWPDSFAATAGAIYFTTAQIHLGDQTKDPFRVWRLTPR